MRRPPILLLIALTCAAPSDAIARTQSADEARRLAQQAEARMIELRAEADRLAAQARTLLGELRTLELERGMKAQALKKAEADVAVVNAALAGATTRLHALEAERVAATPGVNERLVELYKRGRGGYARLLLAADDLQALGRLSRGVAAVARLDRVRLDTHRRTLGAERDALADLERRKQQMTAAQAEALKARRALDAAVAAHNRRVDEIDRRRDLAAQYIGELQAAASQLQRRVAGLATEAPSALPLAPFRGSLPRPVTGAIVTPFGRSQTRFGSVVTRNGVEIAARDNLDVRAVHGGTVAFAAPFVGYGTLVIVDHGGSAFTLYGHLQEATVAAGARISQGSVVGRTGRNPDGDEVLYFELRIDGRPVDPVQWLRSSR